MKLKYLSVFFFLISWISFPQQGTISDKEKGIIYRIDLVEFKKAIIDKPVTLIDVRTKREYDLGHIDGAININVKYFLFVDVNIVI